MRALGPRHGSETDGRAVDEQVRRLRGASTARAPSSPASASARSGVRFHTRHLARPGSRSAHTAARALPPAPSTSARMPAGELAERRDRARARRCSPPRSSPSAANVSVFAAPISRAASLGLVRERERRLLVRDRDVRAEEAREPRARASSREQRAAARAGAGSASPPARAPRAPRCASPASGCARPASRGRRGASHHSFLHAGGWPPFLLHRRVVGGDVRFERRRVSSRTPARRSRRRRAT